MNLKDLINEENILDVKGTLDIDVENIVYDSRYANKGSVFVAIKGFTVDGHDYIEEVVNK